MPTETMQAAAAPLSHKARNLSLMVGVLVVVLIGATIRIYARPDAPQTKTLVPLAMPATLPPPSPPTPHKDPALGPVAEPERPGPDGPPADLDLPTTAPTRASR
ncbi:MAG: hypothetical protein HZB16_08740 [Armatimonadetes bacterium]|nr:hypothetical protein [Armatimonadota bacterium]